MSDSKKSSDEESIVDKIVSSIEKIDKIDKIDSDESKDENNEDKEINNENNEEKSKKDFDNELPLTSKADEFLSDDLERKFPLLAIIGTAIGIIIIIFGIISLLSASERVVDSVASGETGTISIFIIFLGILILGISVLKILAKTSVLSNTFDNFSDLTLLDEDEFDSKTSIEKEQLNQENSKLNEDSNFKGDYDSYYMAKLEEFEEFDNLDDLEDSDDLEELKDSEEFEDLEDSDEFEDLKDELDESIKLEEVEKVDGEVFEEIYEEKVEIDTEPNYKEDDSNTTDENK